MIIGLIADGSPLLASFNLLIMINSEKETIINTTNRRVLK